MRRVITQQILGNTKDKSYITTNNIEHVRYEDHGRHITYEVYTQQNRSNLYGAICLS